MIGRTISHYRILDKLGAGGMGEVFLAEDITLDRRVAMKVLPEKLAADRTRVDRFEREAKTIAALNHPNIVTIHSVEHAEGLHFLTMELVEGESLDRLIPQSGFELPEFFDIAVPLAEALAAAHAKGITHRDLKPSNVMLSEERRVKVLDFGLAKLLERSPEAGAEQAPTRTVTAEGRIVGTVPYMSPEQIEGKSLDQRTDIFSLGILLYEMATGIRPFHGESSAGLISSILKDQPATVTELRTDVPRHLGRIIGLCLEKDPSRRYQSALDVRNELETLRREMESGDTLASSVSQVAAVAGPSRRISGWYAAAAAVIVLLAAAAALWWFRGRPTPAVETASQPSVAVLPFQNLGEDRSVDYLRLAVPDEITTTLSHVPALAVRPFASAASFQSGQRNPLDAGRELGAASVVTGQYFHEGDQLHLTLEAIDVERNVLLWRESVSVEAKDLISLRQQVADRVRDGLLPRLGVTSVREPAGTRPTSQEAYDLFLRSLAVSRDPEPNKRGVEMLERVVELDPDYAAAWAELAGRYYYDGNYSDGGERAYQESESATQRALELDPELVLASVRLIVLRAENGQLEGAYDEAERLVARRPENGHAHFVRAYVLRYAGLLDEAVGECNTALTLDPSNRLFRSCAIASYLTGAYERAFDFISLESETEWAQDNSMSILLRQGKRREALKLLRQGQINVPYRDYLARCLEGGSVAELSPLAQQIEDVVMPVRDGEQHYWTASNLTMCGHSDAALRLLRQAVRRGYCSYPAMDKDPLFAALRDEPRFAEIRDAAIACQQRLLEHRAR